jgi:hypothetical protein
MLKKARRRQRLTQILDVLIRQPPPAKAPAGT